MTANVEPAMAQTPAARPSIPSRKLTMFMIATTQTIVAAPAAHSGSSWLPKPGNVKRSTVTPNPTATEPAATWPASLPHHGRPRKSSMAPTVVAIAAPSRIPR